MRVTSILSLLALGAISGVTAKEDAPANIIDMQWEIEYAPGKTDVFSGTIEKVHERIMELNPDYHTQMKIPSAISPENALAARREEDHNECYPKSCKNNKTLGVSKKSLRAAIETLRSMKATPFVPAKQKGQPEPCPLASCNPETGAAVLWCNSNEEMVMLGSHNDIADAVEVIMSECTLSPKGEGKGKVGGERVHADGITVKVKKMKCPGME